MKKALVKHDWKDVAHFVVSMATNVTEYVSVCVLEKNSKSKIIVISGRSGYYVACR